MASVLYRNGPPSLARSLHTALAVGATLGRVPFTLAEHVYVRARRIDQRPLQPPIFIIGHWRSGTTHLYNILSKSPQFGYVSPVAAGLPWDFLILGRLLHPILTRLMPKHRYIDAVPVNPDSPQEDESALACMQAVSFFHGLYFSRQLSENMREGVFYDGCDEAQVRRREQRWMYFLHKVAWLQNGRRLLIKNPGYTARVAEIRRLFPEAKFVHIHRNPLEVFQSMQRLYARLLEQFSLQDSSADDVDELILQMYERMMSRLIEDSRDVPADHFVDVDYKQLDESPLETVEQVFRTLKLEGWEESKPRFEAYLASVRSYKKTHYDMPNDIVQKVRERWGPIMARWGYRC